MKNKMNKELTYDEAIANVEALIKELESIEALGLEEYRRKASEAQELLAFCRGQLTGLEQDLDNVLSES